MPVIDVDGLVDELNGWTIPASTLEATRARARETLDELKGLIDYQDRAAGAMLTVMAFLAAAAGLVYQSFADRYPWPGVLDTWQHALTTLCYVLFFLYLIVVAISAFMVFFAVLPRYAPAKQTRFLGGGAQNGVPASTLFYRGVLSLGPERWGRFFTGLKSQRTTNDQTVEYAEVNELYAKFAILESYLVADDARRKVEAIARVRWALPWAAALLIGFALCFSLTMVLVKGVTKDAKTSAIPGAYAVAPTIGSSSSKRSIRWSGSYVTAAVAERRKFVAIRTVS